MDTFPARVEDTDKDMVKIRITSTWAPWVSKENVKPYRV